MRTIITQEASHPLYKQQTLPTTTSSSPTLAIFSANKTFDRQVKMPTSHISTPLNGVDAGIVIAALHNHDLMIKTLCPALISYHFESGNKNSEATYSITDRKPIGQVGTG
jgi:hypothetical protein